MNSDTISQSSGLDSELFEQQLQIEKDANDFSYSRLVSEIRNRIEHKQADELAEGKMILLTSIDLVAKKLKEYFDADLRGKAKTTRDVVLMDFYDTPRDLAYIVLVSIVRSISKEIHIPTTQLMGTIVRNIHQSILLRRLDSECTRLDRFLENKYEHRSEDFRKRKKLEVIRRQELLQEAELNDITTSLGAILIDIVIKSGANVIETKMIQKKNGTTQHIMYTEECFRMVLQSRERLLTEYKKYPILLVEPKDWESFEGTGGYYTSELYKMPIIKAFGSTKKLLKEYFKAKQPTQLYTILNHLQKTPWRVNKRVYETMMYIFDNNVLDDESPRNNPYLIGKLPYNGMLEAEDFINPNSYGEIETEGKYRGLPKEKPQMLKYFRDLEEQRKLCLSNSGKALMTNLVLQNAEEYLGVAKFFFSYQFDFRGRIYPIQQHLQPQGDGKIKALLEFYNGYPLDTDEAIKWFMIHGANCYGYDKDEYEDRLEKIQAKHTEILQVAEEPIKYRHYWKDADDPYLYLAWCFEYADWIRDPSGFLSHIPIALDATCSGIQIYSGLLLDKEGAEAVNVIGNVRNDIYQRVADKGNELLAQGDYPKEISFTTSDKEVHTFPTEPVVASIKGKINRKLTKRNTMTQPYSVTKFGMYEQLKAELNELEAHNKKFWVGDNWMTAKLLTEINDKAISSVVKGARIGQEYLKEVTREVVGKGDYVFYTTPITFFPVLQKIHKTKVDRLKTPIGYLSIRKTTPDLHPQKMVNGIAPNFIHSLDATLLAYTLLKLVGDGVKDFHFIHDSYGVPANKVEFLNRNVREAYIELFKAEPLRRWLSQVCKDYPTQVDDIMVNTLNLDEVMESRYIFS